MASADGFTRYDILGDRVPEARAEKMRQREAIEKRAVRSAVRSKILVHDAKNSPILATDPSVASAISASRVRSADAAAERIVGDLFTGGVKRARGGADPRVRQHKIKSADAIKAETRAVLAAVDKAREDVIERGDPLAHVKVSVPREPGPLASQAEKKHYRAAIGDAIRLAEKKQESAAAFAENVNQVKRAERAIAKGEVGLSALALEHVHPELFGRSALSELEDLRERRDRIAVATEPQLASPIRRAAATHTPLATHTPSPTKPRKGIWAPTSQRAPTTIRFERNPIFRNPPPMTPGSPDREMSQFALGTETPATPRTPRTAISSDMFVATTPQMNNDLVRLDNRLADLRLARGIREKALAKANASRKPVELDKLREIDKDINLTMNTIRHITGTDPRGRPSTVQRHFEGDPRQLIAPLLQDNGAGAFPPGTTNVEAWFGPKGLVNGSNRLAKAKLRANRRAYGGKTHSEGFFNPKRGPNIVKPDITYLDVIKPFVSGALTALTL